MITKKYWNNYDKMINEIDTYPNYEILNKMEYDYEVEKRDKFNIENSIKFPNGYDNGRNIRFNKIAINIKELTPLYKVISNIIIDYLEYEKDYNFYYYNDEGEIYRNFNSYESIKYDCNVYHQINDIKNQSSCPHI